MTFPIGGKSNEPLNRIDMAASNFVEYRRIERYADRVTMEPICTEYLNDKELEMLKQSLKNQGYKYVGRFRDTNGRYYTKYAYVADEFSNSEREVTYFVTITKLK